MLCCVKQSYTMLEPQLSMGDSYESSLTAEVAVLSDLLQVGKVSGYPE